jgi:hypothetical protein
MRQAVHTLTVSVLALLCGACSAGATLSRGPTSKIDDSKDGRASARDAGVDARGTDAAVGEGAALPVARVSMGAAMVDPCDPRARCPAGFGLCIRCDSPGDPRWVFSVTGGAAGTFEAMPEPDCRRQRFDARGFVLSDRGPAERSSQRPTQRRWFYDRAQRLVRSEVDRPNSCDVGCGDSYECQDPDGVVDELVTYRWSRSGERTIVQRSRRARWPRSFSGSPDPRSRAIPRWNPPAAEDRDTRFELDAEGRVLALSMRGATERWTRDARERALREQPFSPEDFLVDGLVTTWSLSDRVATLAHVAPAGSAVRTQTSQWTLRSDGWLDRFVYSVGGAAQLDVRWTHTVAADGRLVQSEGRLPDGRVWRRIARRFDGDGFMVASSGLAGGASEPTIAVVRGAQGRELSRRTQSAEGTSDRDLSCLPQALWDAVIEAQRSAVRAGVGR